MVGLWCTTRLILAYASFNRYWFSYALKGCQIYLFFKINLLTHTDMIQMWRHNHSFHQTVTFCCGTVLVFLSTVFRWSLMFKAKFTGCILKKLWWALIQIKGLIKISNEAIRWLALFHLLPVNCFLACLKGALIISKRDRLSVLWWECVAC